MDDYNCEINVATRYSKDVAVQHVIDASMKLVHQKYAPTQFCVRDIDSSSFIQQMLHLYHVNDQWEIDYNKEFLNQSIVRYSKVCLTENGMTLWIVHDKYNHKIYETE
eukprot:229651_1